MPDTFRSALAAADEAIFDGLGETVTISNKGALVGVFENEVDLELGIQGTRPILHYQESDMTIVIGDSLIHDDEGYTVRRVESDGMGMGKLILSKD